MKSRTVTLLTIVSVIGAGSVAALVNAQVLGTDFDQRTPMPTLVPVATTVAGGDDPSGTATVPVDASATTLVAAVPADTTAPGSTVAGKPAVDASWRCVGRYVETECVGYDG